MGTDISNRKQQHLDLCLEEEVEANQTLLDGIRFLHCSLPEMAVEEVDLSVKVFGKKLSLPLLITGMTGGTSRAGALNRIIAEACEGCGVAMGLGSQRAMLENPHSLSTYHVREVAPSILLFGNIGAAQLKELSTDQIRYLVDSILADALCIHLNPAQEMLQHEGDRDFRGFLDAIKRAADVLDGRIIVKETGAGLSPAVVRDLANIGVAYVDVSGAGGTSWTKIERMRSGTAEEVFDDWGIPTAASLLALNDAPIPRIASGGLRHGLDVARSLALGATLGGMALPALRAAGESGTQGVRELIEGIREQLAFICLNTGSRTPAELKDQMVIEDERIERWAVALRRQARHIEQAEAPPPPEKKSSRLPGFYKLSVAERREHLAAYLGLPVSELAREASAENLTFEVADRMTENAIGTFALPFGVGLNFLINGHERIVPMVIEEPSVIAAVSRAARAARAGGGFTAESDPSITVAQVHLADVTDLEAASQRIYEAEPELLEICHAAVPRLVRRGGGARRFSCRNVTHEESGQKFLTIHIHVDVVDAMGANLANTVAEHVSDRLAELSGGRPVMRILTNYADERLARSRFHIPFAHLGFGGVEGKEAAHRIEEAWRIADADPYRAVTHNKGVMNGIDAVATALGQDIRALEGAAHAFAARSGQVRSLTRFTCDETGLLGEIELPMQVSTVGPLLATHPGVALAHNILGCRRAHELACVLASVGLAQNLAAVHALVTEGIQRGHMNLHHRRVVLAETRKRGKH